LLVGWHFLGVIGHKHEYTPSVLRTQHTQCDCLTTQSPSVITLM